MKMYSPYQSHILTPNALDIVEGQAIDTDLVKVS